MSHSTEPRWHELRTDETRLVEGLLEKEFERVEAYRYNSVSIRVRVVDSRFVGMPPEKRDALVEAKLATLPQNTLDDVVNLLSLTPEEASGAVKHWRSLANHEFEDPTPSDL